MNQMDIYMHNKKQQLISKGMTEKEASSTINKLNALADELYSYVKNSPKEEQPKLLKQIYDEIYSYEPTNKTKERNSSLVSLGTYEELNHKYDIIIVESNARMQEIIDWCQDNFEAYKTVDVEFPFKTCTIHFQEEDIIIECEQIKTSNKYRFYVYMHNVYMCEFEAMMAKDVKEFSPIFRPGTSKEARKNMLAVLKADNTLGKLVFKFKALMVFSLFHREYVVAENSQTSKTTRAKRVSKAKTEDARKVAKLSPTRYIITQVPKEKNGVRAYTKPDHEVECRGGVRHLKNGKVVPFKGCVKYKGQSKKQTEPKQRIYKA